MGVSLKQSHQLMASLATNIDWDSIPSDVVQAIIDDPKGAGKEATRFLRNRARLQFVCHGKIEIDLDADPALPEDWRDMNWKVYEHVRGGKVTVDPVSIELWLSAQQSRSIQEGTELRKQLKRLKDKLVLNSNMLHFLLENSHLIPENWKGKDVFFFGTVYRISSLLYVRCLSWNGTYWRWYYRHLYEGWKSDDPVALLSI